MAPSPAHPSSLAPPPSDRHTDDMVEVIDLYTEQPMQLERLLEQWRSTALAREHLARAEVTRDDADRKHLVLRLERDATPGVGSAALPSVASPEVGLIATLLDRPPHFRRP